MADTTFTCNDATELNDPQVQVVSSKRTNVDEQAKETPLLKKYKADQNVDVKMEMTKLIIHWHEYIITIFELKDEVNDIDIMSEVTSIVDTIHIKFKQETNGSILRISDEHMFTIGKKKVSYGVIKNDMRALAKLYALKYDNSEEDMWEL